MMIQKIKMLAKSEFGLHTDNSYDSVIVWPSGEPITHLLFAAYPRQLRRKTWWFPVIGNQPYLGFFEKEDRDTYAAELEHLQFDIYKTGALAFSLLGYLEDPIFSTMLERSNTEIIELFLHEWTHRTLYLTDERQGRHEFNENLAEFVSQKGTEKICLSQAEWCGLTVEEYKQRRQQQKKDQIMFVDFLKEVKQETEQFLKSHQDLSDHDFQKAKKAHYESILKKAELKWGVDHPLTRRFSHLNNAKLLALQTYHAREDEFEKLYQDSGENLKKFLESLKNCVKNRQYPSIWETLEKCQISG